MKLLMKWEDGCMPTRANPTDAGLDLVNKDDLWLQKGQRILVGTGVRVRIYPGFMGLLVPRSGLSKDDVIMTNSVGIIDSDYRGEIKASLMYTGPNDGTWFTKRKRIVQLIIVPIVIPNAVQSDMSEADWSDTVRGAGGFGSTGI